ncbi:hypothetical protein [Streptomyces cyanogenus]|uniref:hypothetical protein n=1 Tax=Streptomyces cyanogenus TaxID=80860 RepID=UPI001AA0CBE6|nr:hypothetical protein [Streptomyces cyanogenus]
MPVGALSQVRVEPSWWRALRIGAPGRHPCFRPGRWCAGELVHANGRDFVALIEGRPALIVDFHPWQSPYARLALSVRDPQGLAELLLNHAACSGSPPTPGRRTATTRTP